MCALGGVREKAGEGTGGGVGSGGGRILRASGKAIFGNVEDRVTLVTRVGSGGGGAAQRRSWWGRSVWSRARLWRSAAAAMPAAKRAAELRRLHTAALADHDGKVFAEALSARAALH